MEPFFNVTMILVSAVLVVLILLHSGKDAGLSGAFGVGSGGGPFGGGSLVERHLTRWAIPLAVLVAASVIVLLKIWRSAHRDRHRPRRPASFRAEGLDGDPADRLAVRCAQVS